VARFPPGAVPFAGNGTGDLLVFLPDEDGRRLGPAVYWWDHETGEIRLVADDFADVARGHDEV
jgi:hypothetical protein